MPVSWGVGPRVYCRIVRCFEKAEHEKDLSTFVQRFDGRPLPELVWLPIVLGRPLGYFYFFERFDYWACDCEFELRLDRLVRGMIAWLNNT